jgi:hypothetical protein
VPGRSYTIFELYAYGMSRVWHLQPEVRAHIKRWALGRDPWAISILQAVTGRPTTGHPIHSKGISDSSGGATSTNSGQT